MREVAIRVEYVVVGEAVAGVVGGEGGRVVVA